MQADRPKPDTGLSPVARQHLVAALNKECTLKLPESLLEEFIKTGTPVVCAKGEKIISEGETDDNLYIIEKGIMRCWHTEDKKEVTQAFAQTGTIILSFHSYYAGEPSPVNIEACCPSVLLKISKADYDSLVERSHLFARWCLRVAQCQLYHYEIRHRVIRGDAYKRYQALVRHRPEILRNVPLKIIASYLGITPEYLSTLRKLP